MNDIHSKRPLCFLNQLPMTKLKLSIARFLYYVIRCFLPDEHRRICRHGIYYDIDLSEGIDFSLFLFGHFQSHVINNTYFSLPEDAIIFDVGANVGSMTLQLAQKTPNGHVYAFEPTDYAFKKLVQNLSINPGLSKRVTPIQTFVSDISTKTHQMTAYASWKIDKKASDIHPLHGGSLKNVPGIEAITIDGFCEKNRISKVDFIKIDTDGYEYNVLQGARKTVERYRPYIIFEIGQYLLEEKKMSFERYEEYFSSLRYTLVNSNNNKNIIVTKENYLDQIPLRSAIDLLALPQCIDS